MQFFKNNVSKEESRDTGMAMVLLLLILYATLKRKELLWGAVALHVLNMAIPVVYKPIAVVWLGLSNLLGIVVSKLLMAVVFFAVVTPIGVLRRLAGKDSLKLRMFKSSDDSVMSVRHHIFTSRDLERPY